MMPKPYAKIGGKIAGAKIPVFTAEQMDAYRGELGTRVAARLDVTNDELAAIGALQDAMMPLPAAAVRELIYDLRQLLK